MKQSKLAHFKEILEKLRDELESELISLKEDSKPVSPDVSLGRLTRQEALQAQNIALEALRQREIKKQKILSALHRISEGKYGECLECGESIGDKRLEIQPESWLCIECANIKKV